MFPDNFSSYPRATSKCPFVYSLVVFTQLKMSGAANELDQRAQWLSVACRRFLSNASQAALNASVAISSQICHNIYPPRSLPFAVPLTRNNSTSSSSGQPPRPAARTTDNTVARVTQQQADGQTRRESQFDAYLRSQGPRALELAPEEEYRRHYNDSLNWRSNMGVDALGETVPYPAKSAEIQVPSHGVFERSVEKRMGAEELRPDWIRFCNKHGSRSQRPSPSPSNIMLAPCESMDIDMKDPGISDGTSHDRNVRVDDRKPRYHAVSGRPLPVEPPERAPLNPPVTIQINGTDTVLTSISAAGPSSYDSLSPLALSATSMYLPTRAPMTYSLSSPASPSLEAPCVATKQQEVERKTPYFALYPPEHKLGFNCLCEVCRLKELKKKKPDAVPTLFERRALKRKVQEPELLPAPETPQDSNYTFSSVPGPQNPPCEPVGYFMSGNVMVPKYNYKEQLRVLEPSTWLLGDTVVYGVKSRYRSHSNKRRARKSGIAFPETEEVPVEEYGEGRKRRRK
ncbi:hypothetical protein BDZ91DRAFT_517544 [Kalaharituber pfeilii]|nr:hypothetical protein BDZ91DRAFT_517544 [Kalaharituber pfeilii]